MRAGLINQTDYANIYGVYEDNGTPIGEVEERLAGRDVGTHYYSLTSRYKRSDIKRIFRELKK